MKIVTNNNISKDKTSPYFAEKFSYYTRQEIEDFAKTPHKGLKEYLHECLKESII